MVLVACPCICLSIYGGLQASTLQLASCFEVELVVHEMRGSVFNRVEERNSFRW